MCDDTPGVLRKSCQSFQVLLEDLHILSENTHFIPRSAVTDSNLRLLSVWRLEGTTLPWQEGDFFCTVSDAVMLILSLAFLLGDCVKGDAWVPAPSM